MSKRSATLLAGLLCATALGYEARPIPCGPEANTGSNYLVTAGVPFFERQFVSACPLSSDPEHVRVADRLSRREMMKMARWFQDMAKMPHDPTGEAKSLVESGCTHFLVNYIHTLDLTRQDKAGEAEKLISQIEEQSGTGMSNSVIRACLQYARWKARPTPESERALESAVSDALTDVSLGTNWSRQALSFVDYMGFKESASMFERLRVAEAAGSPRVDPWVMLMCESRVEYRKAWNVRGGGYAPSVKPEGWMGYREHIAQSVAALEKAWELHPEHPETSYGMLIAAPGDADACRMWFDRCVEAEFDFMSAYRAYTFGLRPRWCGSHEEMMAFANECLATRRFDTRVPDQYIECIMDIAEENHEKWADVLARPGVYETIKKLAACHRNMGEIDFHPHMFHETALLITAYANGDNAMVRDMMSKLALPDYNAAFSWAACPSRFVIPRALLAAWASQERRGDEVLAYELLSRQGRHEEAMAGFRKLVEENALEYVGTDVASFCEMVAAIDRSIKSNVWVSLISTISREQEGEGAWYPSTMNVFWRNGAYECNDGEGFLEAQVSIPEAVKYKIRFSRLSPDKKATLGFCLARSASRTESYPVVWLEKDVGKDAWTISLVRTNRRNANNITHAPLGIPEDAPRKLDWAVGEEVEVFVSVSHGNFRRANANGVPVTCNDLISIEVNGVRTHDKVPIPNECFYPYNAWEGRRPELEIGNGTVTRFVAKVKPDAH